MTTPDTRFKSAADAVAWLKRQGYKASEAQFSRHLRAGHIARDAEGFFSAPALLGYASVRLQPSARLDDAESRNVALGKLSADSELKRVRAAREQLKLEREQGQLMLRAEHDRDLAARAVFFASEVRGFIHRAGAAMIALVGGREEALAELIRWWERETADWMDAWAADREFADPVDDEAGEAADAGQPGMQARLTGAAGADERPDPADLDDGDDFDGGDL